MSLAKMPNYNLLRYEFGWIKNETPMTITTLAFLRTIHNRYNEHQFEDVFEWYNSLTDNQLSGLDIYKSQNVSQHKSHTFTPMNISFILRYKNGFEEESTCTLVDRYYYYIYETRKFKWSYSVLVN